jgi:uncharacterized lipoprotein YddW (UPF0748 family)
MCNYRPRHIPVFLTAVWILAAVTADPAPAQSGSGDVALPQSPRALWVVRDALLSPGKIRAMVSDARRAGVTDLIVQVRGRGDAYYLSRYSPAAPDLARAWDRYGAFDPLALVLEEAHSQGLRVHAWLNVYLVWGRGRPPDGHVVLAHPDWVAQDADGNPMSAYTPRMLASHMTEGIYLDPGNPSVMRHFRRIVGELVERYPVDGIHLDYVRYPELDVGYSPGMRQAFLQKEGVDPTTLRGEGLQAEPGEGDPRLRAWRQFKADQVSALVKTAAAEARGIRPRILMSAAVKPDPEAAFIRNGQEWPRWVREGWVDVVVPMMYSTSSRTVARQTERLLEVVPPDRMWAGISVYNQSLQGAADKIDVVQRMGVSGYSLFSYNSMPGGGNGLQRLIR